MIVAQLIPFEPMNSVSSTMCIMSYVCMSVSKFSHSVVSNSLRPHGLQHSRLPCPSPAPGTYLNSCPSGRWCHPTISSSVVPFSSHLQSFPASGFFQWVSSSHHVDKVLEISKGLISFRMDWLDLLAIQGTLKSLPQYHSSKAAILWCSAFFMVQLSHPYMTTGKTIDLIKWILATK